MEKLFPISINTNLCVRCQKCSYSCPPKAIFWKNSMRYVDYNRCKGCLKCIEVCEHGAVEVISFEGKKLDGFEIDERKCTLCLNCTEDNFCFQNRFKVSKGKDKIIFDSTNLDDCLNCLKCFKECPNNAIIPKIS